MDPPPRGYDLVSVHYPALRHDDGELAIQALLGAIAPVGTLLVVGHELIDPEWTRAHGFGITDFVQPDHWSHANAVGRRSLIFRAEVSVWVLGRVNGL